MSANSIKKCPGCNKVMLFEQKTVHYNRMWYHERCLKLLKRRQNKFQKRTSFKPKTISKPISVSVSSSGRPNWGVARLITSASLQKCAYCDKFISFKDEPTEYHHKWYHAQCLKPFKEQEEQVRIKKASKSLLKCTYCNNEILFEEKSLRHDHQWYHAQCLTPFKAIKAIKERKEKRRKEKVIPESLLKCLFCKNEILFEEMAIRYRHKWYHAQCLKPFKEQEEQVRIKKASKSLLKCTYCNNEILFEEKSLRHDHQWYHAQCLTPLKTIEEKRQQEKTIVDFKTKTISKPVVIAKKKFDPVITLLTIAIFFVIYLTTLFLFSDFVVMSVGLAAAFVFFQLYTARRALHSKYKYGKRLPSSFAFFMLFLPFIFGIMLIIEGQAIWESYTRMLILGGLTVTFWSTMLFVPIAAYSKYKEENQPPPEMYPSLTVIVPAYNEEKVISRTIESLIATEYPKKEIIVVDDGSKDRTLAIANMYSNKVKVLHKENGGKASALNYGIAYSSGEVIVIVDADTVVGMSSLKHLVKGFGVGKEIAAVAGNIKIRNRVNLLTWCQALEYVAGIQIARRALDHFGSIAIVPGALGAFKKLALIGGGGYDKSTIVEDFDATIKVLKSGSVVQGSTQSTAYTEAPETLRDYINQRKRWYRGNIQVVLRHKDVLTNPRFGFLQRLTFPYMLITMFVLPFLGIAVIANAIIEIFLGGWQFVLLSFIFFIVLQHLLSALAVRIDGDNPKLIAYSTFLVIGYKQFVDAILIKSSLESLFHKKARWTSAKRKGF